ncbi:MAG: dUTP diphosphatase [Actinomycetota bacterium]
MFLGRHILCIRVCMLWGMTAGVPLIARLMGRCGKPDKVNVMSKELAASQTVQIQLRHLDPGLPRPAYALSDDAGFDLHSRVTLFLQPGERAVVPTGIALALPPGYAGLIHPRSGLAARHGVTTLNGPGTIDAGYRGEICVILINTDKRQSCQISRGDRIAQLIVQRVVQVVFDVVDELIDTPRGAGGFGSTGGFAESNIVINVDALEGDRGELV